MTALSHESPSTATICFPNLIEPSTVADVRALLDRGLSRDAIANRLGKHPAVVDAATISVIGFRPWMAAKTKHAVFGPLAVVASRIRDMAPAA